MPYVGRVTRMMRTRFNRGMLSAVSRCHVDSESFYRGSIIGIERVIRIYEYAAEMSPYGVYKQCSRAGSRHEKRREPA